MALTIYRCDAVPLTIPFKFVAGIFAARRSRSVRSFSSRALRLVVVSNPSGTGVLRSMSRM
jgi:hypothetical protein